MKGKWKEETDKSKCGFHEKFNEIDFRQNYKKLR